MAWNSSWFQITEPTWVMWEQPKMNWELFPDKQEIFDQESCASSKIHATCFFWQDVCYKIKVEALVDSSLLWKKMLMEL